MRDLGVGFGHLPKGRRWVSRHGRQYGFGLLPGLITLVLYVAALVALAVWGEDAVSWATPFADHWSSPWQGLFRGFLTAALFALGLLLAVLTFTAVTLLVGRREPVGKGRRGPLAGRHRSALGPPAPA